VDDYEKGADAECPTVMKRASETEWRGSEIVPASGSPNTVEASLKETPWLARFAAAFFGFHSDFTCR
jgi:hypothetical protein